MNNRNGRLRTFAVLGTLTTLALSSVQAGQVRGSENQLLGITLRSSTFRDVLKKYGQPDEVQGGGPFLPTPPKEVATAGAPSGGRGGRGGMPGSGGMSGMPGGGNIPSSGGAPGSGGGGLRGGGGTGSKRTTSKFGFPGENDGNAGGGGAPGSGGRGGYPGSSGPGSGGYPGGGYPGAGGPGSGGYPMPGGPGSGGYPGAGGPGSGGYPSPAGKGGLPGFPGGNPDNGPGSGGGLPGAGSESGGSEAAGDLPATEATWWYHNPRKGYHLSFLFNKDGRVIQIQEYGVAPLPAGATRQGIALGSNMTQVLSRYGWSNDGAHSGENVTMRYGGSDKVAFQMVKNRVLGITVAVGH